MAAASAPAQDAPWVAAVVCAPEFTWSCDWALAVIECESGFDPDAQGVEEYGGRELHFNGWWQVWDGPFEPYANTVAAHQQYVGWQRGERANPWPNCPRA